MAEQIAFLRDKVNLPSRTWTELWEGQHARAFVVAGAMRDELVGDLRAAVAKAIESGTTLAEFRRDFDGIVGKHGWAYKGERGWRTRVIYETNLRTSYHAGRYRQMKAASGRRPYWRYRHSEAVANPRKQHLAWDGLVLRHDDPFWDTHFPPNGWGCQCSVDTLADRDLRRLGKTAPDEAPEVRTREVRVGTDPERLVSVPEGIDPGWGYNVGVAAWGRPLAERAVAQAGQRTRQPLTQGDWRSEGRPDRVPAESTEARLRAPAKGRAEFETALTDVLGGPERVFTLEREGFRYPVLANASVLAQHLPLDRSRFVELFGQALENPFEVWMAFERLDSGKTVLRLRFIRALDVGEKGRPTLVVVDAQQGQLVAWTATVKDERELGKQRRGKLLMGR
jgi:hypothetical protein